jgi:ABC-2 type transport system ATP-binding protein
MSTAISLHDLRKRFGRTVALNGLSIEVEEGDVYGFLGPNGAGKTTSMRILATLLRPDSGTASVLGHDVVREATEVRPLIGYMPDSSGAYRDMLVSEYLEFFAAAYRVPAQRRATVVKDCISLVGLENKSEELIEGLSRGMRQRLGLARCLIHDPKVLILDEPASGLDPRARIEILEVLKTLGSMGKTVLISSHILSELGELCDTVAVIERGKVLATGTMQNVVREARPHLSLFVRALEGTERLRATLLERPHVEAVRPDGAGVAVDFVGDEAEAAELLAELVRVGLRPVEFSATSADLEDVFLSLTEGKVQ